MRRYTLLVVILIMISCRDEKETGDVFSQTEDQDPFFKYSMKFPDTVYVNELNEGEIIFESPFDTITETFSDSLESRYVVFRTLSSNSYKFLDNFYNDSLQEYRIGAIDNRTIPFYELSFNQPGIYKIKGYVNDQVLLESNTEHNSDSINLRLLEMDFPMSFNVVVIDSTK